MLWICVEKTTQLITLCVQYRFDDEVKDDAHDAFTPEMMKISSRTRSLVSCTQRLHVSTVGSIEGWIHSKRRNNLHQQLVVILVRTHTNEPEEEPEV